MVIKCLIKIKLLKPLNAKKVSELSGVEKKEVDKIMKELKKDETIVSPKRCYWTLADK